MRGQMELMGLVIIVILITVGFLFVATFSLKEDKAKHIFTRKGLASSTLSALLKTTVLDFCGGDIQQRPKLGEILKDCGEYYQEYYPPGLGRPASPLGFSRYQCQGVHSCKFFQDKVAELLLPTLDTWGKNYELTVTLVDESNAPKKIMTIQKGSCSRDKDSSGLFPIQAEGGLMESQLSVCD